MIAMNRISTQSLVMIIGTMLLLMNTFAGFVLTVYHQFNMILNDVIIVMTTLLIYFVVKSRLKVVFRISLPFIFSVCGIVQFAMGFFSPAGIADNYILIGIVLLVILESLTLLLIGNITERHRGM